MKLAFVFVVILGLLTLIVYLYWGHITSLKGAIRERKRNKELRKDRELARALQLVDEWKKTEHESWTKAYNAIDRREP